jgi:hypothetical protein
MRRNVLFATRVAPSLVLWATVSWSGAYQAGTLPQADASENLCRADEIASFGPAVEEPTEKPARERVFGAPFRGVLSKAVIDTATTLLDDPMGNRYIIEVNGIPYGFRLEPHYHPPGFEGGPIGWHKGVTVYEIEERDSF